MGLYTSIILAPQDDDWQPTEGFIRGISDILKVDHFDHHAVYKKTPFWRLPFADDHNQRIASTQNIGLDDGIAAQKVGGGFSTHMMFPFGKFMEELCDEITSIIPEKIYQKYSPWDTSIRNGYWETFDFNTGKVNNSGTFSFTMSADGCPSDLDEYLNQFLEVPGVQALIRKFEEKSGVPWRTSIILS